MFWQVAFLMYLFIDLSRTEPVVSKLLVISLFDLTLLGNLWWWWWWWWNDVIWYLFTAVGFPPVAVVGKLVQKWERNNTKRERVHKTIQKHKIHKIENKNTKQKTNIKRTLKS